MSYTPDEHAKLSPSAAHRWLRCPASLLAESFVPNRSSSYANEGTAAHELAAWTLRSDHKNTEAFLGRVILLDDHGNVQPDGTPEDDTKYDRFEVTQDMCDYVQEYVDGVVDAARDGKIYVEVKVDFSDAIGIPNSFGTADAVILSKDGTELQVHDLKYGRGVHVDARDNEQLLTYAVGALEMFDLCDTVESITTAIHMPRKQGMNDWTYKREEVDTFARLLQEGAETAIDTYNKRKDPELDLESVMNSDLAQPSTKACQWCNFKSQCPALGNVIRVNIVGETSDDEGEEDIPAELTEANITDATEGLVFLSPEELGRLMDVTGLVDAWVKAVREQVTEVMLAGGSIPGYKLVQGKKGARQWVDNNVAEQMLKSMRVKQNDMYSFKLISPTQAEKVLKNSKRRWNRLQECITQADGSISVAPEHDKRKAVVLETAQDDEFKSLNGDDDCGGLL